MKRAAVVSHNILLKATQKGQETFPPATGCKGFYQTLPEECIYQKIRDKDWLRPNIENNVGMSKIETLKRNLSTSAVTFKYT